jgi:CRISPR-associated protein Cmx8
MTEITDLSKRVHDIVQQYVSRRTKDKSGMTWDEAWQAGGVDAESGKRYVHASYRDAREKVCQSTFLDMRSRRSREDFVEFFTGTVCSVPQFLPPDEYQLLARALFSSDDEWEQVKALSMLTLSGLSQI